MRISVIFMFFMFFCINGCKPDGNALKEITQDDLIGEWKIYSATRNGIVTKSLEKGNFVFQADNLVTSNLFSSSNSLNFTYNKANIKIKGDPNITFLKIQKLQNDTLVLSSKMKVFDMEFYLVKNKLK